MDNFKAMTDLVESTNLSELTDDELVTYAKNLRTTIIDCMTLEVAENQPDRVEEWAALADDLKNR